MQRQLENFILDPKLAELEKILKRFNIFRALGVVRAENKHSNFFAFLLDPQETHRLGDKVLKGFLANAVRNANAVSNKSLGITPLKVLLSQFSDTRVYREASVSGSKNGRIDILITTVIDNQNWVFVIENKVDSMQSENQLSSYREYCEKNFSQSKCLFFYLTPDGTEVPDDEKWITITYRDVMESLEPIVNELSNSDSNSDFSFALQNYMEILRSDIMQDGENEIAKLCREIYDQHRAAISEITKYSGDARSEAYDTLSKYISNQDGLGKRYHLDGANLRYIRFVDSDIKKLLGQKFKFLDEKETKSGCPIYFSVINEPDQPLKACIFVRLAGYNDQQRKSLNSLANLIDAKAGREWKRTEFKMFTKANMADANLIDEDDLKNSFKLYLEEYEKSIFNKLSESIQNIG